MRGHRRKYNPDGFQHIFQHAIDYRLLFYSTADRLVFFTIYSVMAVKYGVIVLALALMFNHFHTLIQTASSRIMALFIGTVTSTFAHAFNKDIGRKGAVFQKAYGNSIKASDKKVRTCISYNYNNSVEKGLFARAEDDRWNFLAYIGSPNPFSEKIELDKASKKLRASLKEVDAHVKDMVYLNYKTIRRLFKGLSAKEHEQLLDYIISRYLPIDKDTLLSFYKGCDEMVMAINSNTGSEYDIKEEYNNDSDRIYTQMLNLVEKSSFAEKPHSVIMAEERKKWQIAAILKQRTGAKDYQVARVLHIGCPKSR